MIVQDAALPTSSNTDDVTIFEALESEVRVYCRKFPIVFDRAQGAELRAADGRTFIDFFCGAGSLNYGHNHPYIKRQLIDYLASDGITNGLDLYTTAKRDFLTRFREVVLTPRNLDYKVQFCGPTGANAIEAAIKLARKATGRPGIVSFSGSFHGMSHGALSVTGASHARSAGATGPSSVTFVPFADGPSGPFDSVGYLARMLDDPSSGLDLPAGIIVEPLQMEGGVYPAPAGWLQQLRSLTSRLGILLICDEIQVGCGRAGTFFCFEDARIVPDIVTLSKSISGYGLPMSLALLQRDLDVWEPGEHTGTFRGNQLAFVAAAAALELWQQPDFGNGLAAAARSLDRFGREISELDPRIIVRGRGMVLGIDLRQAGGASRAEAVQQQCFNDGLIVELCGRGDEVVKVMPPLTIDPDRLERGLQVLHRAVVGPVRTEPAGMSTA